MKVIKRDGRAVEYDKNKIEIAINKANNEVKEKDRATPLEIKKIIEYIEEQDKKRILVEDIQDIIEQKLMEFEKYSLAKKYIVYRYTRALVRKQNTTDETILSLIRNETKIFSGEIQNSTLAASQRDFIAGEISCDLTKRILLPQKIIKAEEEGILHFHNSNYFIQPIINSSVINIEDMLENGTMINNIKINTPKTFMEACEITAEIILDVANNQYGLQKIKLNYLSKYVNNIENINSGIELLKNILDRILTVNGRKANVLFGIVLDDNDSLYNFNKEIYNKFIEKELPIKIIHDNEFILGDFDQGKVTINLEQIAIISNKNEEIFFDELKNKLELVKDALMYKHYSLVGTISDVSPILWKYGGIARLNTGEKIDSLLSNNISTLTVGYIGLNEAENNLGKEIKNKFNKIISDYIKKWREETKIRFVLCHNEK